MLSVLILKYVWHRLNDPATINDDTMLVLCSMQRAMYGYVKSGGGVLNHVMMSGERQRDRASGLRVRFAVKPASKRSDHWKHGFAIPVVSRGGLTEHQ